MEQEVQWKAVDIPGAQQNFFGSRNPCRPIAPESKPHPLNGLKGAFILNSKQVG